MKKYLVILFLFVSTIVDAQTYYFKAFQFAYKEVNSYGKWTNWSNWEPSSVYITMDLDTDKIVIYSPTTQVYQILSYSSSYTDNSGGKQSSFRFIDQDGDIGTLRLRVERNGNSQIYIDFANVMWVYNVRKM